jgi:hypothetical protein
MTGRRNMTTKGLSAALKDSSMPDEFKKKLLQEKGYSPEMAQRVLNVLHDRGPNREPEYEKYVRDPARHLMGNGTAAKWIVPQDLQAAGSTVGSPFGPVGTFLGSMVGGRYMGRSDSSAFWRAALDALANRYTKKAFNWAFAGPLEREASDRASSKIGQAFGKRFRHLYDKDPNLPQLKVPTSATELVDHYGGGRASAALNRAGQKLGDLRRILSTQPRFRFLKVPVKERVYDAATDTYKTRWIPGGLPMDEAIEYGQALYGKAYLPSGKLRAAIPAGADQALAAEVRQNILKTLRGLPQKIGAQAADDYEALSRDYGMASVANDVFDPKTVTPGTLLNHEQVYQNLAKKDTLSHVASLIGEKDARGLIGEVAPGRARIQPSGVQPIHPHIGPVGVSIPVKTPAIAPPSFQSVKPAIAGAVVGGVGSQGLEKLAGDKGS